MENKEIEFDNCHWFSTRLLRLNNNLKSYIAARADEYEEWVSFKAKEIKEIYEMLMEYLRFFGPNWMNEDLGSYTYSQYNKVLSIWFLPTMKDWEEKLTKLDDFDIDVLKKLQKEEVEKLLYAAQVMAQFKLQPIEDKLIKEFIED